MTAYSKQHRRQACAALALLGTLTLAGCGDDRDAGTGMPDERAFGRYCATCHGFDGSGRPPAFPPLADSEWLSLPDEALALIVLYGLQGEIEVAGRTYRGIMPGMSHLDDGEIADALAHVTATWGDGRTRLRAGDVARLRVAFPERRRPWRGRAELEQAL